MAHISGLSGEVQVASATATGIKEWSVDYVKDTIEYTDFADAGVKSYVLGGSGWAGSFSGYKDGIALVLSTATALLTLKEGTATGQVWTGAAYVTGFHDAVVNDGIVTYSYDFQGTGVLTPATA